jgi:hypothetical protein
MSTLSTTKIIGYTIHYVVWCADCASSAVGKSPAELAESYFDLEEWFRIIIPIWTTSQWWDPEGATQYLTCHICEAVIDTYTPPLTLFAIQQTFNFPRGGEQ